MTSRTYTLTPHFVLIRTGQVIWDRVTGMQGLRAKILSKLVDALRADFSACSPALQSRYRHTLSLSSVSYTEEEVVFQLVSDDCLAEMGGKKVSVQP